MLIIELLKKKSMYSTLTVALKFARYESVQLITECGKYCKRRCLRYASLM